MVSNQMLLKAIDASCKACREPLGCSARIEDCQETSCPLWPVRRGSSQRMMDKPLRVLGTGWTQDEERKLLAWVAKGKSMEWIATQLFRTPLAVSKKLDALRAGEKRMRTILGTL